MHDLDVLRQHEDRLMREDGPDAGSCDRTVVGMCRRHPHVDDRNVGTMPLDRFDEHARVAEGVYDLMTRSLQQTHEALAEERGILRDYDPHGSTAVIVVPRPGELVASADPPIDATRSRSAVRAKVAGTPPTPSSVTRT